MNMLENATVTMSLKDYEELKSYKEKYLELTNKDINPAYDEITTTRQMKNNIQGNYRGGDEFTNFLLKELMK